MPWHKTYAEFHIVLNPEEELLTEARDDPNLLTVAHDANTDRQGKQQCYWGIVG